MANVINFQPFQKLLQVLKIQLFNLMVQALATVLRERYLIIISKYSHLDLKETNKYTASFCIADQKHLEQNYSWMEASCYAVAYSSSAAAIAS